MVSLPRSPIPIVFETILNNAPIGIGYIDGNLRYQYVNPHLAAINGQSIEAHIGRTFTEVVPELAAIVEPICRSVLDTGEARIDVLVNGTTLARPGEAHDWISSYYPISIASGAPIGIGIIVTDVTQQHRHASEREQLLISLRDANGHAGAAVALLESLLANAPVGFAFIDRDLRYRRINRSLAEMNGRSVDEHIGRRVGNIFPRLGEVLDPLLLLVMESGTPIVDLQSSGASAREAGVVHHWTTTLYPVRLPDGELLGVGVLTSDVTAQQRAERERTLLVEVNTILLEDALDAPKMLCHVCAAVVPTYADGCTLFLVDEHERLSELAVTYADEQIAVRLIAASAHYRKMPGFFSLPVNRAIRARTRPLLSRVGEDDLAQLGDPTVREIYREAGVTSAIVLPLQGRSTTLGVLSLQLCDDRRRYTEADLAFAEELARRIALSIEHAQLYHTNRLAVERAQMVMERLIRLQDVATALTRSLTPEAVIEVAVNEGGGALGSSRGLVALTNDGRTELEIVFTKGYSDALVRPWQRFSIDLPVPLAEAARTRAIVVVESQSDLIARYPAMAGNRRNTDDDSLAVIPLIVDGDVIGVLGFSFIGVRRFSAEDRAFMATLAQQCAQILAKARLYAAERAARAAAENALRTRDQLVSIASHELKTPLTAMLGNAQLLQRRLASDHTLSERNERAMRTIVQQAGRMRKLIDAMLDLSRIQGGYLSIQRAPLDLVALMQRVVIEYEPSAEQHRLEWSAPQTPLLVGGDALRLEQVMQNLISNAIKYSPQADRVEIALREHGSTAEVEVRDFGIGIAAEDQPYLFQRFFRGENAQQRAIGGMGIGLYVVKEIVELHSGSVDVTSAEGEGSSFRFRLPLLPRDEPAAVAG